VVYPNPAKEWIRITLPDNQEIQHIDVFNSSGRFIQTLSAPEKVVSIQNLPQGLYVLRISTGTGNRYFSKIIKMN
jgi:hypothetical protein